MELDNIEAALICNQVDRCRLFVDKQPDRLHERWQTTNNRGRVFRRDNTGRTLKEYEAESVSSGFDRHQCIFQISYAADFDSYHAL